MEQPEAERKCCSLPSIPQRHITAILTFLTVLTIGMLGNSLPLIITQMVKPIAFNQTLYATIGNERKNDQSELSCPLPIAERQQNNTSNLKLQATTAERFEWSEELQGIILASFYIGYVVMHLPCAFIAQRFGGKCLLLFGVACSSVFSLLTPAAVSWGGANALIAIRIIIGSAQGGMWPAVSMMMAAWIPTKERNTVGSMVFSGLSCGNIAGNLVAGLLLDHYRNWHVVFYVFGTIGMVVTTVFFVGTTSQPSTHRFISDKEKAFLEQELGQWGNGKKRPPTPWRSILTSVPVIALIIDMCCGDWAFFVVINGIPKYMNDVLHVDIKENGIYSSLPWTTRLFLAFFVGAWADWLIRNNKLSVTHTRKLFITLGAALDGTFMLASAYGGCNPMIIGIFFIMSVASRAFLVSSTLMNSMDLSPIFAGAITALANGLSSIAGICVPIVVGFLTPNSLQSEWRVVFWITFIVHMVKIVNFALFGSGEIQKWNTPEEPPEKKERELHELYDRKQNDAKVQIGQ